MPARAAQRCQGRAALTLSVALYLKAGRWSKRLAISSKRSPTLCQATTLAVAPKGMALCTASQISPLYLYATAAAH